MHFIDHTTKSGTRHRENDSSVRKALLLGLFRESDLKYYDQALLSLSL